MPHAERKLWLQLRGEACGIRFRRQVSVGIYVLDFYCPALRLAIEVDGTSHQNDASVAYDAVRQRTIEALGVRFLRITNEQVFDKMPDVMEMILKTVAEIKADKEGAWTRQQS